MKKEILEIFLEDKSNKYFLLNGDFNVLLPTSTFSFLKKNYIYILNKSNFEILEDDFHNKIILIKSSFVIDNNYIEIKQIYKTNEDDNFFKTTILIPLCKINSIQKI